MSVSRNVIGYSLGSFCWFSVQFNKFLVVFFSLIHFLLYFLSMIIHPGVLLEKQEHKMTTVKRMVKILIWRKVTRMQTENFEVS